MLAQALICDDQQQFSLQQVLLPDVGPDQIGIRTCYSGVSIGTEFALIRNKISWGPYPLCTGYQGTGVVETVGHSVKNFRIGQRVFFRANSGMQLASGQQVSVVSGTHCSHVVVNPNTSHGADLLHEGAQMDLASLFVMPAVGLNGVDQANPRMGQHVIVHGAGMIGLGVIAALAVRGCVVTAVDTNAKALVIAGQLGADHLISAGEKNWQEQINAIMPDGANVVFECTGLPQCINTAIELCRPEATLVWQGNYGAAAVPLKFLPAHNRRLRMVFPCDDGGPACRRAVIKAMSHGTLPWQHTVTHRINAADAPEFYTRINSGKHDVIGAVIQWS